jgi:glucose-6-phosphate 1-dehydrogenase
MTAAPTAPATIDRTEPAGAGSPSGADPCVLLILGASGDLTHRKLIPSMYEMHCLGALHPSTAILGMSRTAKTDESWRAEMRTAVQASVQGFDPTRWQAFEQRLFYHAGDAATQSAYPALVERLGALADARATRGNILFYLSVAPSLYEPIVQCIDEAGLVSEGKRWCSIDPKGRSWQRIVVEKPFGTDEASAASLNRALGRVFEEDSTYRIDHYLGKDLVQSLLVLRFANSIFEPVWNHRYIDHVQITAAETVGVGTRGGFYEQTGAVRDMIQSHLMQVLAFVAMEPPNRMRANEIRSEKIKLIGAIRPTAAAEVATHGAFGQYGAGPEPAYAQLQGVAAGSTVETFAAIKLHLDTWRWAGTPFYLRTGKAMRAKRTEVVVQFKAPAADLFKDVPHGAGGVQGNRLVIEIAPRERAELRFESKVPGRRMAIAPIAMQADFRKEFGGQPVEAYGPLIVDAMRGDQSLFKHRTEVEGAWSAVMPFLDARSAPLREGIAGNYAQGSWGPRAADDLMLRDGRAWHDG